jgi:ABC-type multidrug transport system fused ATPase/permease subunit
MGLRQGGRPPEDPLHGHSISADMTDPPSRGLQSAFTPADMPVGLLAFALRFSGRHQLALSFLAVAVFLMEMAPLELQRRIVNDAFRGGDYGAILALAGLYAAVAVGQGLLKLWMNIYRSWIGEKAVLSLRRTVYALPLPAQATPDRQGTGRLGIESSIMLAEAEPIGAFIGVYLSEPLLQGGILVSIFGYMVYLHPPMALVSLVVFAPQFVFIPLMQAAINRRVKTRISTLREVAGQIVREGAGATDAASAEAGQLGRLERVFGLDMGVFGFKFTMNFLMNAVYHFGTASVLAAGGWFVVKGETEVGTVVAFVTGLSRISGPWGDLVDWFRDLKLTETRYELLADAIVGTR